MHSNPSAHGKDSEQKSNGLPHGGRDTSHRVLFGLMGVKRSKSTARQPAHNLEPVRLEMLQTSKSGHSSSELHSIKLIERTGQPLVVSSQFGSTRPSAAHRQSLLLPSVHVSIKEPSARTHIRDEPAQSSAERHASNV